MKFSSQRQIFRPKSNDEKSFPGKDIKKVWKNGIKFIYILWMVSVTEDQIFFSSKKKRQSKEKRNYVRNGIIFLETNQGSKDNTYIAYCGKSDKNESPATE